MRQGRAKNGTIRGAWAAFALTCSLLVPASAAADWNAPQIVSGAGSSTSQTRVAGGIDGNSLVVWKREVGGFDVIQATRVASGGTQGSILTLSPAGQDATDPVVTARSDGSTMVGWVNASGTSSIIQTVAIAADGTVGPVVNRSVAGPAGQDAKDISIAVGADGTAGVAWRKYNGTSWVIQAVKVTADGTSGTIHDLSEPASSANEPDIAAAPPITEGAPSSYRIVWSGGTGDDGNVFSREITAEDALTGLFQALFPRDGTPPGIGTGGDPHDVQIAYETDGTVNILWVRNRMDIQVEGVPDETVDRPDGDPDDIPFYNRAIEWIRGPQGTTFDPGVPQFISTLTPIVYGQPYNVSRFTLEVPFGSRAIMAWIHDLNEGGYRIETARVMRSGGQYQGWADPAEDSPVSYTRPVISANASGSAVVGWTLPGLIPGSYDASWARFSDTSALVPFSPAGDIVDSDDPGFVVANSGNTMAAFTAIDGSAVGTSRIATFTRPGIGVNPGLHNYGGVNVGVKSTRFISIRNNGETVNQITGISLSGPNADQFSLEGANECVKAINSTENCQFGVSFTPSSVGAKNAMVTVESAAGSMQTDLIGSGVNRTRNRLTATPRNTALRKGKVVRIKVKAANLGGVASKGTKVCARMNRRALRLAGQRCRRIGSLAAGSTRILTYRVRVTWRARRGVKNTISFRMFSGNAVTRKTSVNVRRKGR